MSDANDAPIPKRRVGHNAPGGPPGNKKAIKHGYYSLVKLIKSRNGALDRRSVLGKMVVATARQLEADLGGSETLSTAQRMLIHDVSIDTLLLQALESRLDVAPIRKGKIHPVYTLRAMLIAQRRDHLKLLGLKRVPKAIITTDLIKARYAQDTAEPGNGADDQPQ